MELFGAFTNWGCWVVNPKFQMNPCIVKLNFEGHKKTKEVVILKQMKIHGGINMALFCFPRSILPGVFVVF